MGPPHANDRPTSLAFDAQGRLVVHELGGRCASGPPGSILEQPTPTLLALPELPQIGARLPRIARTDDGRIIALLRSTSVYIWSRRCARTGRRSR